MERLAEEESEVVEGGKVQRIGGGDVDRLAGAFKGEELVSLSERDRNFFDEGRINLFGIERGEIRELPLGRERLQDRLLRYEFQTDQNLADLSPLLYLHAQRDIELSRGH